MACAAHQSHGLCHPLVGPRRHDAPGNSQRPAGGGRSLDVSNDDRGIGLHAQGQPAEGGSGTRAQRGVVAPRRRPVARQPPGCRAPLPQLMHAAQQPRGGGAAGGTIAIVPDDTIIWCCRRARGARGSAVRTWRARDRRGGWPGGAQAPQGATPTPPWLCGTRSSYDLVATILFLISS